MRRAPAAPASGALVGARRLSGVALTISSSAPARASKCCELRVVARAIVQPTVAPNPHARHRVLQDRATSAALLVRWVGRLSRQGATVFQPPVKSGVRITWGPARHPPR